MSNNNPVKGAIVAAKIAGAVIGSAAGQPQGPATQMGNYQKSSIPQTAAQVNTGRSNPSTSGK